MDASVIAVAKSLVLAEKVADLAAAHADVSPSGRCAETRSKGRAESHDRGVRLAVRVEVRSALTAATTIGRFLRSAQSRGNLMIPMLTDGWKLETRPIGAERRVEDSMRKHG